MVCGDVGIFMTRKELSTHTKEEEREMSICDPAYTICAHGPGLRAGRKRERKTETEEIRDLLTHTGYVCVVV